MTNAINILATWVSQCPNKHSDLAYQRARIAVFDTVACMLAGAQDSATERVRTMASTWGGGKATLFGGCSAAAPWAALVNGTAAHAMDFDDYDLASVSHPSAVLVPALIALGEERCASGSEILDAYIVGLEVIARVGMAVNMSHYALGWHATATIGAIGAAAACARMMNLNAGEIANAISLATSMASGYKSQFGTMAKPVHAGLAAKSGVIAAAMGAAGITASSDTLDGQWSFLGLLGGSDSKGFKTALETLGEYLSIEKNGLVIKPYPCCGYTHRAISGLLQLREQYKFVADEIVNIKVSMADRNAQILVYQKPHTSLEARFSLEFCIALAVLKGRVTLADFVVQTIHDPQLQALLALIELTPYPADPNGTDCSPKEPDGVTVRLRNGADLNISVNYPPGGVDDPITGQQLHDKYWQCIEVAHRTSSKSIIDADKLESILLGFEHLDDVNILTSTLGYIK